jgi:AhpD family alkylhydroperoxidase
MKPRLNPFAAAPAVMKAWLDASNKIAADAGLEPSLVELVKIRASQINGCANCLDMHAREALAMGESATRLLVLDAWHEAPFYSARERAALAWTEALTLVSTARAPDGLYEALRAEFSEEEQVKLTLLINVINGWNRVAIGFGVFGAAAPAREAA